MFTRLKEIAIVGLALFSAAPVSAHQKDWQGEWNRLVTAAKKEGRVVVSGSPDAVMRRDLPAKFTAKFGIAVEYLGIRSGDAEAKLRMERQANATSIDVFLGSSEIMVGLYQDKMLDPVRPALVLPDVLDKSKWKKGDLWFMDPESQYILRLAHYLSSLLHFNTQFVKPEELKSVNDLLNPKWRGKISTADPAAQGTGSTTAIMFYKYQGEDFVKKLYIDQKPRIDRNTRALADALARGTHPISLNAHSATVERLREDGFPVVSLNELEGQPGRSSPGAGMAGLVNRAPHPNAAKVFLNWIASKEGMEAYSRARLLPTTRNDIDESFLPEELVPRPGVNYFDFYQWDFLVNEQEKIRHRIKEILNR
jgi:iron(III) transport system substrate-binding protein